MMKKAFIFIVAVYGLVLIMYVININRAKTITEPAIDLSHVLNQEMLRLEDYQYLLRMKQKNIVPDAHILRGFKKYFQLVVDSIPNQADAYAMLGYCQYYLHEEDKAKESYQKAIAINSNYIGFYYNLAVILYNQGQFQKAALLLQQSMAMDMRVSMVTVLSYSRTAMMILNELPGSPQEKVIRYVSELRQKSIDLLKNILDHSVNFSTFSPPKMPLDLI